MNRQRTSVERINFLLLVMLGVSAVIHGGVVLAVWMVPDVEPAMDAPAPVRILPQTMVQVQTNMANRSRPPSARVEPRLPEVDLPDLSNVPSQWEKSVPDPSVPSPLVARHQMAPEKPAAEQIDASPQQIKPAVHKIVREIPSEEPRSSVAMPNAAGESRSSQDEGGNEPTGAAGSKLDTYLQDILRQIERKKYYPLQARSRGLEGKAAVRFHLQVDGRIALLEVLRQSGHAMLDRAALQAVRRAAPFPPRPEGEPNGVITLEVILVYRLDGR